MGLPHATKLTSFKAAAEHCREVLYNPLATCAMFDDPVQRILLQETDQKEDVQERDG